MGPQYQGSEGPERKGIPMNYTQLYAREGGQHTRIHTSGGNRNSTVGSHSRLSPFDPNKVSVCNGRKYSNLRKE